MEEEAKAQTPERVAERQPVASPPTDARRTPSGWFQDPTGRSEQRYWDGNTWTEHVVRGGAQSTDPISGNDAASSPRVAPLQGSPSGQTNVERAQPERWCTWVAIGGFVAMFLGLLMPWASVTFISVNGIDTDDGKLFGVGVVIGILVFWASYRRPQIRPVVVLLAGGLFAFAVYEIVHVATASASFGTATIHGSPGAGLYLDAAGAAAVGIAQAVAWRNRKKVLPE